MHVMPEYNAYRLRAAYQETQRLSYPAPEYNAYRLQANHHKGYQDYQFQHQAHNTMPYWDTSLLSYFGGNAGDTGFWG